jgi:AbrB family looped-hinge helix DNA binding protein
MQQVTVGTKNQIVLPKEIRQKIKGLKPGRKVSIYSLDESTIAIKLSAKSWLDSSYGAMKALWSKSNPIEEVEKMRDEWNEKS